MTDLYGNTTRLRMILSKRMGVMTEEDTVWYEASSTSILDKATQGDERYQVQKKQS